MGSSDFAGKVNQALLDITRKSQTVVWSFDEGLVKARFGENDQFEVAIYAARREMILSEHGEEFGRIPVWDSLHRAASASADGLCNPETRLLEILVRETRRLDPLNQVMQALQLEAALTGGSR